MFLNKKILAIIPARGGSKGILNKNIVSVCGQPLIAFTIEAAQQSKYIDRIYISTDSPRIAQICYSHGVSVNELRPDYLATDQAKTIDTIKHTLQILQEEHYDYVVVLQPTQPLRQSCHIDKAIELIIPEQVESIVSVTKADEHPIFMRTLSHEGRLVPILALSSTIRRQELDTVYRVNGAIYINSVKDILNSDISLNDNTTPYIMDKAYDLDVDTQEDLDRLIKLKSYHGG